MLLDTGAGANSGAGRPPTFREGSPGRASAGARNARADPPTHRAHCTYLCIIPSTKRCTLQNVFYLSQCAVQELHPEVSESTRSVPRTRPGSDQGTGGKMISLHISGVDSTGQYGHLKLLVGDFAIFRMLSRHIQWPQGRSTGGLSGVLCEDLGAGPVHGRQAGSGGRATHQTRSRATPRQHRAPNGTGSLRLHAARSWGPPPRRPAKCHAPSCHTSKNHPAHPPAPVKQGMRIWN